METKRKLGKSELQFVPFVLGGNVFGWTADEKTSFDILDAYVDLGFDFIDTADSYSAWAPGNKGGESETIIGKWLQKTGKRSKVIISTKVGSKIDENRKGLKKDYILREVEESLRRLKTDHIDLYFSHYDDMETPIAETLEAYTQLVNEGKVRYIGTSNMTPERVRESLEISRKNNLAEYICLQPEYNLYDRSKYEKEYEPIAQQYGLGVISYYSLASGFLTGKYHSVDDLKQSQRGGGIEKYLDDRGKRILTVLTEVARQYKATPAQVALAWILARPSVTAPIASVSKSSQMDIVKCVDINLDKEAVDKLTEASEY